MSCLWNISDEGGLVWVPPQLQIALGLSGAFQTQAVPSWGCPGLWQTQLQCRPWEMRNRQLESTCGLSCLPEHCRRLQQEENPQSGIQLWLNHKNSLSCCTLQCLWGMQRRREGQFLSLHPDWLQAVLWCKHEVKGGGIVCNNIVFNTHKGSNIQVTHLN